MLDTHWHLWYFNYWLTHLFYLAGGLVILIGIASNKYEQYKTKLMLMDKVRKYSGEKLWLLNQ